MRARDPADAPGWDVLDAALALAVKRLGDRLAAAYAIGSLGHGSFSAYASDVDLALLIDDAEPIRDIVANIAQEVATSGSTLSRRLSVFHGPWRRLAEPSATARFPAIDRLDLVDSGVLVHGSEIRGSVPAPDREEVIDEAVAFTATRTTLSDLASTGDVRKVTKAVMSPVRLAALVETGRVMGNDAAAQRYEGEFVTLVADAIRWRHDRTAGQVSQADLLGLYLEQLGRVRERDDVSSARLLDPLLTKLRSEEQNVA